MKAPPVRTLWTRRVEEEAAASFEDIVGRASFRGSGGPMSLITRVSRGFQCLSTALNQYAFCGKRHEVETAAADRRSRWSAPRPRRSRRAASVRRRVGRAGCVAHHAGGTTGSSPSKWRHHTVVARRGPSQSCKSPKHASVSTPVLREDPTPRSGAQIMFESVAYAG